MLHIIIIEYIAAARSAAIIQTSVLGQLHGIFLLSEVIFIAPGRASIKAGCIFEPQVDRVGTIRAVLDSLLVAVAAHELGPIDALVDLAKDEAQDAE